MIKIENKDTERQKLSFVSDMNVSLANAIRRSALEIPVMAIDNVEITKNDSALYDEIIAHRIGLVPIKTDKVGKEAKFKLVAKGPKIVYSDEIVPSVGTSLRLPIVILDDGQELEIVCNAQLGKGIEHIKHSPGLIFYKHNLDEDILDYVSVDGEGKVSYNEAELKNKGLSEEKINEIKKIKEVNELIFNIESWGQMDVSDIFIEAIGILNKNLGELGKGVK